MEHPRLAQVVLDTTDARGLAEFWRQVLGLAYRPGDEPPPAGQPDERGTDWLVLRGGNGGRQLAFQQVAEQPAATWPEGPRPQQLHLDLTVGSVEVLAEQHERVQALGAPAAARPQRRRGGAAVRLRRPGRAPVLPLRRRVLGRRVLGGRRRPRAPGGQRADEQRGEHHQQGAQDAEALGLGQQARRAAGRRGRPCSRSS